MHRSSTRRLLAPAATLCALAAPAAASAADYDDSAYLRFADTIVTRLDRIWDERAGRYLPGGGGTETMTNANLLLIHSVAAQAGHHGPARNDARARRLARALVDTPPYVPSPSPRSPGAKVHSPGWVSSMGTTRANQHEVIDADVVDGLVHAWSARRALGLPRATSARIARAIHRTATSAFWRWPAVALNQFNWHALLYAADATVTGDGRTLARDLRRQIERFAADRRNFGAGLRFRYIPERPAGNYINVDTTEYANITASFSRFYAAARRAGMRALSPAAGRRVRAWFDRVLAGYWTHSGYLNWDTGLGFNRWHQVKKLGLSQMALVGMASAPELQPRCQFGAWAKWTLDRSFDFYARVAARSRYGLVPGLVHELRVVPQSFGNAYLGATRVAANAARAVEAGLGRMPGQRPPPLYAFDPDIGRLAVTTPAYSTAVVPVSQGAFPYGGIELARLYDGRGEVAANIGGRPPAAFGLAVSSGGTRVLTTQKPRTVLDRSVRPLRLTRAPAGVGASTRALRSYARPFGEVRATGTVTTPSLRARTTHTFTPRAIETSWDLERRAGRTPYTVDVRFPSTGGRSASVIALGADGSRRAVTSRTAALREVSYFHLRSRFGGYVVVPVRAPAGATMRVIQPRRQSSAPDPGPTLSIRLGRESRAARFDLGVRLAPASSESEAAAVAARLSR